MDTVILVGSLIFVALWLIIGTIIAIYSSKNTLDSKTKSEYRSMSFSLTFLGAFCMWLMWVSVYLHQKYPLIRPVLKEDTVDY